MCEIGFDVINDVTSWREAMNVTVKHNTNPKERDWERHYSVCHIVLRVNKMGCL